MSKRKGGLGKGLEALLGSDTVTATKSVNSHLLKVEQLTPNPYQPRKTFDAEAIAALADSIRRHGIIQPLAVRPADSEGQYEIIAGERRFRAAQQVGLAEVPVVIHEVSDSDSAAFALIENLQREDLNVIEKAKGIQRLIDDFELTHEACGQVLGQSRSAISNTLRLLELSEAVQEAVVEKVIDMGHARALLPLEQAEQYDALQKIRLNGLSVRETEDLVRESAHSPTQTTRRKKNAEVKQLEVRLSEYLQTKVNISQQSRGNGKITMVFSDDDMLKKLTARLGLE